MTVSLMSAIRRRPGMTRSEFFDYLVRVHGELAKRNPLNLAGYRQNHVLDLLAGVSGEASYSVAPDRDNVTELEFANLAALFATMGHAYTREVLGPDGANFSDLPTATALVVNSREVSVAGQAIGPARVLAFLASREGLSLGSFADRLDGAIAEANTSRLCSLTVHHRMVEGDQLVGYFGGEDAPSYQAALTMTFPESDAALTHARELIGALGDAVDAARSFAALVDMKEIYKG